MLRRLRTKWISTHALGTPSSPPQRANPHVCVCARLCTPCGRTCVCWCVYVSWCVRACELVCACALERVPAGGAHVSGQLEHGIWGPDEQGGARVHDGRLPARAHAAPARRAHVVQGDLPEAVPAPARVPSNAAGLSQRGERRGGSCPYTYTHRYLGCRQTLRGSPSEARRGGSCPHTPTRSA